MNGDHDDEARSWRDWLARAIAGEPSKVQILYGIGGERRISEVDLDWLAGYEGSRPVRAGNAASAQFQIDIYGEVFDALYQARVRGLSGKDEDWRLQCALLEHLATVWKEPDESIWEVRGGARHFVYSKVMAWVAFDRAVKSVEKFALEGPLDHWREIRDAVHEDVCTKGFDVERGTFVQSYGSKEVDASALLIPLVGFLPPEDKRVRGTIAAIEKDLLVDGLVLRYDTGKSEDGLPPGEGVFLACSFWYVDNLVMQDRLDEAVTMFERLISLQNDLGLLSEEYDPIDKRLVGNFPQAFSHIALVNSASNLERAAKPAEQRTES
jgi:GH15 family glucan-1,4-alpha-glucosidase